MIFCKLAVIKSHPFGTAKRKPGSQKSQLSQSVAGHFNDKLSKHENAIQKVDIPPIVYSIFPFGTFDNIYA